MKRAKQIISLLLVFALLFSTVPVNALAATTDNEETVSANQVTDVEEETIVIEDLGSFETTGSGMGQTTEDTQYTEDATVPAEETTSTEIPSTTYTSEYSASVASASEYEATISGVVLNEDGNGLAGIAVTVYDVTNKEYLYTSCTTDSTGTWKIEDAWIGDTYLIAYYKAGYVLNNNNIRCTAVSGGTVLETVTATKISGLVCNEADYTYTTDATNETATITGYTGSDAGIILPSTLGGYPVTAIASDAFDDNKTLVTVALSENITTIGSYAFDNCTGLKNVYLPNILTTINAGAFRYCSALEAVELPDSIKTMGGSVFYNCTNLSTINYPLSWSSAGSSIFSGCSSLTTITIPEGVTSIPGSAFDGAS